jgi:hypothetical protein
VTRQTDLLHTFTGVPTERVVGALQAVIARRGELQTELVERLSAYPLESMLGFLLASSAAFYLAEREVNPKIKTFVDAFYYISTCLSVGYADMFAQTQRGRAIASLAMVVGPALTNSALDPPGRAVAVSSRDTELLAERLDAILEELRRQRNT